MSKTPQQRKPFPPTRIEGVAGMARYGGPRKSLADMERAIAEDATKQAGRLRMRDGAKRR